MTVPASPAPRRNLTAHIARVLEGTGVSPAAAAALAAGEDDQIPPGAEPVVRALREGWDAAGPDTGPDLASPA